jgi:hypothetical protein
MMKRRIINHTQRNVFRNMFNSQTRKYSTNIQQHHVDLRSSINRLNQFSVRNDEEQLKQLTTVRERYVGLLENWNERIDKNSTELTSFNLQFYKTYIEFMLFLEMYSQLLLEKSNVENIDSNQFVYKQLTEQQLQMLHKSIQLRNTIFKIYRFIDTWSKTFPEVKSLINNANEHFNHVHLLSNSNRNPFEILKLNSSIYGVKLGTDAMNYQLVQLSIKIFQTVLKDLHYLPVRKYLQLINDTKQIDDGYAHDSEYDTQIKFTEKTDMIAVMAMSNLIVCYRIIPQINVDLEELINVSLSIVKKYLENSQQYSPSSSVIKHMMLYNDMIQSILSALKAEQKEVHSEFNLSQERYIVRR